MKFGSICYLPPPHIGQTKSFFENLRNNPSAYPIYFYSDHPWEIDLPNCKFHKVESPESVRDEGNLWSIPKLAFIEGVGVAQTYYLDFFLVLEPDCRVVGTNWDVVIYDEFFNSYRGPHRNASCGGTFYLFNTFNETPEWATSVTRWLRLYGNVLTPIEGAPPAVMLFGADGCAERHEGNAFTNGALTVLKTDEMALLFPPGNGEKLARSTSAYDVSIGYGLKALYGNKMFDHLVPLQSVWSYYGNLLYDEEDRKNILSKKLVRAIHQIKSDWIGPQ